MVTDASDVAQTLARLEERITHMQSDITSVRSECASIRFEYVRLERYMHVERVVLGLSAAVALGLVGLLVPKLFGGV
jgi:hypothetical protein